MSQIITSAGILVAHYAHTIQKRHFAHFSRLICTVEALVRGHPHGGRKESITGAGPLQECVNREFVWVFKKTGFWPGGHK